MKKTQSINTETYIPFLKGRPNKEHIISKNEILNLRIDLNALTPEQIYNTYGI